MFILSQILVVCSDICFIVSMLNKKKLNVVLFLILSSIFFASHFACLGAWTGAAVTLVEILFLIIMYVLEKHNNTTIDTYVSIGTIIVTIALSILTWEGAVSLLPMFAMVVYYLTMMFSNLIIVKSGAFIRLALNGIYMFLIGSYFGAGLTIVLLIFTIVGIVKDKKQKQLIK